MTVAREVDQHAHQPGLAVGGTTRNAPRMLGDAQEGLLDEILGVFGTAAEAQGEPIEALAVVGEELVEIERGSTVRWVQGHGSSERGQAHMK